MMVKIEAVANPAINVFHTRILLSTVITAMGDGNRNQKLTPLGQEIIHSIENVPGIEDFTVNRYHIDIHKGEAFGWGEIIEAVLPILEGKE